MKLDGHSPNEQANSDEMRQLMNALSLQLIPPDEVCLLPRLLNH
jgi:hypothetical protein